MKNWDCETCKWGPLESECRRTKCRYEEFSYGELAKKQEFAFLESISFDIGYFEGYVDEVMERIEVEYGDEYRKSQVIKDNNIFNWINENEFLNWVVEQFPPIRFGEKVRRYFM